jgi:uncharacterized membrane protein
MLLLLAALICVAAFAAGPAHWTLVQTAFRLVCHQMPERCLAIAGMPMPVCARCAGIYVGAFVALLVHVPDRRRWLLVALSIAILDWASEAVGIRPAWVEMRLATGLLLGLAAAPVLGTAVREARA